MSYRTIKKLLGETSLERKCRFLFGSGLLVLITGSFYLYARQTSELVYKQNEMAAKLMVFPVILEKHWKWSESGQQIQLGNGDLVSMADNVSKMAAELKPLDLKESNWTLMKAEPHPTAGPVGEDYDAMIKIREGQEQVVYRRGEAGGVFRYYGAVRASESCIGCHRLLSPQQTDLQVGDLIGIVKISFPLEKTQRELARNNAVLLATGIITAFLAMLAAYAIVRYVIVKPVLHLKDVSDNIARGALDLRADIRTGDEFEELSHAFNRMLRHLVTVQEELLSLNRGYESKNDELAQANLRLYELNNLKNEFLATMSHELRTPLNSILGFSDVLVSSANLSDKQRRYVNHIQSSGRNLLSLINDVLDLAKIESGKMEMHPVEFTVADLIERMVGSMMPLAENKNIDLGWDVDSRVPVVYQDPGKLQQVLNNLLSNAIKFTPEGGRVRVRAVLRERTKLAIIVEDTGIGIPLEDQERIFEKFRQGRSTPGMQDTLTRQYEGTGLGLSIVRELSKLLGGDVHLISEFGKGSIFTVTLPTRLDPPIESPSTLRLRATGASGSNGESQSLAVTHA